MKGITVKSCKCGEYGSFEYSLFFVYDRIWKKSEMFIKNKTYEYMYYHSYDFIYIHIERERERLTDRQTDRCFYRPIGVSLFPFTFIFQN